MYSRAAQYIKITSITAIINICATGFSSKVQLLNTKIRQLKAQYVYYMNVIMNVKNSVAY